MIYQISSHFIISDYFIYCYCNDICFLKKKQINFSDQDYQKIPISGYISLPIQSTETQFLLCTAKRNCWITKYIITEGKQTKQLLYVRLVAN